MTSLVIVRDDGLFFVEPGDWTPYIVDAQQFYDVDFTLSVAKRNLEVDRTLVVKEVLMSYTGVSYPVIL